ncbi:MAG: helix-turn-helix transcriptional regulator, partial [Kiritimatiellae bacterium]|nr:helix-turn-helix transcriptional regulator [Kiritimatiellia bacterium]
RLQVAAQYLSHSEQGGPNVTEIAHMCGYREPLYFSRIFKKKYGVAPSAYADTLVEAEIPRDSDSMKIMM